MKKILRIPRSNNALFFNIISSEYLPENSGDSISRVLLNVFNWNFTFFRSKKKSSVNIVNTDNIRIVTEIYEFCIISVFSNRATLNEEQRCD